MRAFKGHFLGDETTADDKVADKGSQQQQQREQEQQAEGIHSYQESHKKKNERKRRSSKHFIIFDLCVRAHLRGRFMGVEPSPSARLSHSKSGRHWQTKKCAYQCKQKHTSVYDICGIYVEVCSSPRCLYLSVQMCLHNQ